MTRRRLIIALLFFVVVGAGIFIAQARSRGKTEKALPNSWLGITPGQSTVSDLASLWGPASSSTQEGSLTTYFYPSGNQYWKNEVSTENQTVEFVRERIFAPAETSLKKTLGDGAGGATLLYGPDFFSGILLYAFPQRGLAYLASADQDTVYEIWRFPSMTITDLIALPQVSGYALTPQAQPE